MREKAAMGVPSVNRDGGEEGECKWGGDVDCHTYEAEVEGGLVTARGEGGPAGDLPRGTKGGEEGRAAKGGMKGGVTR